MRRHTFLFLCCCLFVFSAKASDTLNLRKSILYDDSLTWELSGSNLDSAFITGRRAYARAQELNDSLLLFKTVRTIGAVCVRKGYYKLAVVYYTEAQTIGEKINIGKDLAKVYSGLAIIFKRTENYTQALAYNQRALSIDEQTGDSLGIAADYNNMGVVLRYLKQFAASVNYLEKAIAIRRVIDKKKLPTTFANLGNTFCESGQHEKAIAVYLQARAGRSLTPNDDLLLANLGDCYGHAGETAKAHAALDSSLVLATENGSLYSLSVVHSLYANFKEKNKDYAGALIHLKQYISYSDSLNKEESLDKLTEFEEQYESAKKDLRIEQLKRINLGLALTSERNERMLWTTILCAIAGVFFILFLFQRKRRIEKARQDKKMLEEKEKGIAGMLEAVESERERIARDLHDGIAQQIAAMKLALEGLSRKNKLPEETEKQLQEQIGQLDLSGKEIRSIAHDIMPPALRRFGLAAALSDLTEKTFAGSTLNAQFDDFTGGVVLPENIAVHLYRVSQEIISNTIKHAQASSLTIQLLIRENRLVLRIEDNGKGFSFAAVSEGAGLLNIQNRVTLLKGEMHIDTAPGAGVICLIRVPL